MKIDIVREYNLNTLELARLSDKIGGMEETLEYGNILYFPLLTFQYTEEEQLFFSKKWLGKKAKHIGFQGISPLQGACGSKEDLEKLEKLLVRFIGFSECLLRTVLPTYGSTLSRGMTSYYADKAENQIVSWEKDDTRLHIDAFSPTPTGGRRILHVITNVNPEGVPIVWRLGESFSEYAAKFVPKVNPPSPICTWFLTLLSLSKRSKPEYDYFMEKLHTVGKKNLDYQLTAPYITFSMAPGSTLVMFSDQVLHAVTSGQFFLEQTFYLEPKYLLRPEVGPLYLLEQLVGRSLLPT